MDNLKKKSFPPISTPNAKILILGTMPGEKSLSLNQYYGHGGNQFWKILFKLFNQQLTSDYDIRRRLLIDNYIALWDVLSDCEREGSSDNMIKKGCPNDFSTFYQAHPFIKNVFFNGANAEDYYNRFIKKTDLRKYTILPSTSRANSWKSFEEKFDEWRIILPALKNS